MFDPWIILIVDRTKLGARIWAVREATPHGRYSRRTADIGRAQRFATEAIARNALDKISLKPRETAEGKPWVAGDGFQPGRLFVSRVESADLPRPRPDAPELRQLLLFDLDAAPRAVEVLAPPEPPAAPKPRRRRAPRPEPTPAGWTLPEQGRSRYHYFAAGSASSACLKAIAAGEYRTIHPDPARQCKPCRRAAARAEAEAAKKPARRNRRPAPVEVQTIGGS